ncbi:flavonol 3-O-glucosyltransferase UGT89B1-like [Diospyros lotus]|uniref:flavonol 3-O-glucosyltransferase UGT89B1-like n=1 Tax=Diospyros lotus TaxID=55363 RepID=UPI002250427E|nr:flavonol 3-O-glucosyltransferase UGT89B1-like [Diospyros lotus]
MVSSGAADSTHVLVCPFPAPGHIIPMIDLIQFLLSRRVTVTVLLDPTHFHLLEPLLSSHPSSSLQTLLLSPPEVPPPSTLYRPIATMNVILKLYDPIVQWFRSHPSPPVAIVSDLFLGWTHRLACDVGAKRVVFWSSGAACASILNCLFRDKLKVDDPADENSVLSVPSVPNCHKYPWWQISHLYRYFKEGDPVWELFRESMVANVECWGAVINTFDEFERVYIDHLKKEMGHDRVWAIGPLLPPGDDPIACSNRGGSSSVPIPELMGWLDSKPADSIVYVCFGSSWTVTVEQVAALAAALESSGVNFIWCVRNGGAALPDGFEDRVKGRGFIIKGWAPQGLILNHRAVGAFVTHCGWNSTLEGVAAGVLMLTWPLGADQFINDKLLVDELGVGVRFYDMGNRGVPDSTMMARLLAESVGGRRGARVAELSKAAAGALIKGGSSSRDLDKLVEQLQQLKP